MNFKARVRLILSRFKMSKGQYRLLEKMMESTDGSIYSFLDDGVLIATAKRKTTEEPIRATVRSARIIDKYPRGVAITVDGIKIMEEYASSSFVEVMKAVQAFNKEIYAGRYEKARRNGGPRRPQQDRNKGDSGAD